MDKPKGNIMIELWHGGARWEGGPEVQPPKPERYEAGPGIYLTTRYLRAKDYSRGSKVTTLVTLREEMRWLEQAKLPLAKIEAYVRDTPRFPKRERMLASLSRYGDEYGREAFPVSVFVNMCVNNRILAGKQGVLLTQWLTEQGIDASLYDKGCGEQWVIVFNPAAIRRHKVVSATHVSLEQYDLPLIKMTKPEAAHVCQ
ncbi:hypothetical protein AB4Y45_35165 [Paraburkholderia sp. EG287A]|uniref:hypothetical protein n=1 Tax=Paraburkholderia sp. EG287A TaxID=3237012 RepID=UPI0034D1A574